MRNNIGFEDDELDTLEVEELINEASQNLESMEEMVEGEDFGSAAAEAELLKSTAEKLVKKLYELDELTEED
jgi:hypothetical protein